MVNFRELDKKGARMNMALIERDVRKLWNGRVIQDTVVKSVLQNIDTYLQDEDAVEKLLYLLPHCRGGITVIAQALFS